MEYFPKFILTVFMVSHQMNADIILNVEQRVEGCGASNGGCKHEVDSKPDQGSTTDSIPDQGTTTDATPDQGTTTDSTPFQDPGTTTTTVGTTIPDPCAAAYLKINPAAIVTSPTPYDKFEAHIIQANFSEAMCICHFRGGYLLDNPPQDLAAFSTHLVQHALNIAAWVHLTRVNGSFVWPNGQVVNATLITDNGGDCATFSPSPSSPRHYASSVCSALRMVWCQFN